MEAPRHKHQTQPLYTAPRLSDRFDRVSPLNSRRSNADNYHDNKSSSLQNQRSGSKSLRRHSTNAYTSSNSSTNTNTSSSSSGSNQKELSTGGSGLQHQMNNNSSRYTHTRVISHPLSLAFSIFSVILLMASPPLIFDFGIFGILQQ